MKDESRKPEARRGKKAEFPGLSADAAALGVSRYFLWQVLKGYATSGPLLARYQALKFQHAAGPISQTVNSTPSPT
jgi:hypothetical protein